MKNSVCPECQEPIGLGTYFSSFWVTRIDCPSCKKTVKVQGMVPYFVITIPLALVLGVMSHSIRREHGWEAVLGISAIFVLAVTVLFLVALMTWVRLVRDDPAP